MEERNAAKVEIEKPVNQKMFLGDAMEEQERRSADAGSFIHEATTDVQKKELFARIRSGDECFKEKMDWICGW